MPSATLLMAWHEWQEMMIDGRAPKGGELFKNPTLAATFRALGKGGKPAFYTGAWGYCLGAAVRYTLMPET